MYNTHCKISQFVGFLLRLLKVVFLDVEICFLLCFSFIASDSVSYFKKTFVTLRS